MMLTRHADALVWAGRYLERVETTVRLLDVAGRTIMELWPDDVAVESMQLIRALGLTDEFEESGRPATFDDVREFLLADEHMPGSIPHAVAALKHNLRTVQDRVPVELWEEVTGLHLEMGERATESTRLRPHDLYLNVRRQCQAMGGVLAEAMLRDEGHGLLSVGRAAERAILTVQLVGAALTHPAGRFDAERLLRSTSSLQSFRRLRHHDDRPMVVADFLILEPRVPRTVRACLDRIDDALGSIQAGRSILRTPARQAGLLRARLEFDDVGTGVTRAGVADLGALERDLTELAGSIHESLRPPLDDIVLHTQNIRPGGARR